MAEANVFELQGDNVKISYSARGPFIDQPGLKPTFIYQDGELNRTFTGSEIRLQKTEIGILVSVSLKISVDAGATLLTLLLPSFNLGAAKEQAFETFAIVTQTFGILPRVGARELYDVLELEGMARFLPLL